MKLNASGAVAGIVFAFLALVRGSAVSEAEILENAAKGLRLLRLGPDADPVWKTEDEKLDLLRARVRFVSVGVFPCGCVCPGGANRSS